MDRAGARIEFSPEVVTMNALLPSCTTAFRRFGGAAACMVEFDRMGAGPSCLTTLRPLSGSAACTTRKTKTVTTAKTAD
jgi:hypothetical protein